MTAAIYFKGDAYSTAGPRLMGRNAAGESFLRGYVAHATTDRFWVQAANRADAEAFAEAVRAGGRDEPVELVPPTGLAALAGAGTLYFPASTIGQVARERSLFGAAQWSICGITHTTASDRAMDAITELPVGAVEPWDALICTSRAVRANVEAVLQAEAEHLARRLGATRVVTPQLPVIPLGIVTDDFVHGEAARQAARRALGADEDTLVVLYAGRLSFHAKAHPAAMYAALEAAKARAGAARVVLVECGWFANDALRDAFDAAKEALAPSIELVRLDGREKAARDTAWGGADIFCSLADNIQETFGLTPIEAMAAGLPVVVSDWDGYRDTVRDGVDGFRVPTLSPGPGLGGDLAARFALGIDSYDRYCGYSGAFVAVDIAAATDAFAALFGSADLRRTMGAAGRARAQADYDWRTIVPRYEALWRELGAIRARAPEAALPRHPWPARMDPFASFASYPTTALSPDAVVELVDGTDEAARARLAAMAGLEMVAFANAILPTADERALVLAACGKAPTTAGALAGLAEADRRGQLFRAVAWLAKLGVVRVRTP